jgi:DNA-binding transcriptional MerR regulator
MDDGVRYSIGELARRTGLTVKAVRYYSDTGLLPVAGRTPSGHRRYGETGAARLELIRTLRELGIDLGTVRRVLERELTLSEVAAAHADALTVQIAALRRRHAVLTAVAGRGTTPEEAELMYQLAQLSAAERRDLIGEFLDAVFGGLDADPALAGIRRSMTPELPEHADPARIRAWHELAELTRDPELRSCIREMATTLAAERSATPPAFGLAPGAGPATATPGTHPSAATTPQGAPATEDGSGTEDRPGTAPVTAAGGPAALRPALPAAPALGKPDVPAETRLGSGVVPAAAVGSAVGAGAGAEAGAGVVGVAARAGGGSGGAGAVGGSAPGAAPEVTGAPGRVGGGVPRRDPVAVVREHVGPAMDAGTAPTAPEAAPVVAALTAALAADPYRQLVRLRAAHHPRRDRYLHLLAVVNGWPPQAALTPVLDWSLAAVRAHTPTP